MPVSWDNWVKTSYAPSSNFARLAGKMRVILGPDPMAEYGVVIVRFYFPNDLASAVWLAQMRLEVNPADPNAGRLTYKLEYNCDGTNWSQTQVVDPCSKDEELSFELVFNDTVLAMRFGSQPERGEYVQHPDELHIEEQWMGDSESTTAEATFGVLSHSESIGSAFPNNHYGSGPAGNVEFETNARTVAEVTELVFCGETVPCNLINSTAVTGSTDTNGGTIQTVESPPYGVIWTGSFNGWYDVSYADLPILCKDGSEYEDARLVDAIECAKTGGPDYKLESELRGFSFPRMWTFTCDPGTWETPAPEYDNFAANPVVTMQIQQSSVQAGGSHENEADNDIAILPLGWPLTAENRKAVDEGGEILYPNRFDALNIWVPQGTELEFKNGGSRCSNWTQVSGSGITVENGASYTRFTVTGGGGGDVGRTLVVRYGDRIAASNTPWEEYRKLYPQDADEDYFCLCHEGAALGIYGYFTWSGSGDREFTFAIRYKVRTCTDNHDADDSNRLANWDYDESEEKWARYTIKVSQADRGETKWHFIDLDFPQGYSEEPDIYLAAEYRFEDLQPGDDIRFTSMKLWPFSDQDFDSCRVQVSLPFSHEVYDHFSLACLVGGHQSWHLTEDNLDQLGTQQGIAHVDYLVSGILDLSQARVLHNDADFMVSIDDIITAQGSWLASRHDDVDSALGLSDTPVVLDYAFFLRQTSGEEPDNNGLIVLPASLKCRSFRLASCIDYEFEFEGRVRGAFQGLAYTGEHKQRAPEGETIEVVVCESGSPSETVAGSDTTDKWGHFRIGQLFQEKHYAVKRGLDISCHSVINTEVYWVGGQVPVIVADTAFIEHLPNVVSLFFAQTGIKHIYSGPPDYYVSTNKNQAHYSQPHTDTTEEDASISGYTDEYGQVRLFFIRDDTVYRGISQDWGDTWSLMSTSITGSKGSFICLEGFQLGIIYDDGTLKAVRSKDHFATVEQQATIATGVDECQPSVYAFGLILYALAFKNGLLTVWKSVDMGRTWSEQGAV